MDRLKSRYSIVPQMREYDRIGISWMPYLMFFQRPNYVSGVVNTDERGFRITEKGGVPIKGFGSGKDVPVNILIGNSFVFGVGATSDAATIPSILSEKAGGAWFNFGGRAYGSTQEMLLFLFHRHHFGNIKRVVILSGLNDLVHFYMVRHYAKELGSFFFWEMFNRRMNEAGMSVKRKVFNSLLKPFVGKKKADSAAGGAYRKIINHDEEKEDLLYVIERDINNWKMLSRALNFEVSYFLQPFANWIDTERTSEETELFSILDSYGGRENCWTVLKKHLGRDKHRWFSGRLSSICDHAGVNFFDMNEIISKNCSNKWLFVDRAHFTDAGNQLAADIIKGRLAL